MYLIPHQEVDQHWVSNSSKEELNKCFLERFSYFWITNHKKMSEITNQVKNNQNKYFDQLSGAAAPKS